MNAALQASREITDPLIVIVPNKRLSEEDFVRLYAVVQKLLDKAADSVDAELRILVESAAYFDGYEELTDAANEQQMAADFPIDDEVQF